MLNRLKGVRTALRAKTALLVATVTLGCALGAAWTRAAEPAEGHGSRPRHSRRHWRKRRVSRSAKPAPGPADPSTLDFSPENRWTRSLGPWSALLVEQERARTLARARKVLARADSRHSENTAETAGLELSRAVRARLLPQLDAELARTDDRIQALARQVAARMTARRSAACEASVGRIRGLAAQLGASPNLIFRSLQTSRDDRTNELRARLDGELEDFYAAKLRRVDVSLGRKLATDRAVPAVLPRGLEAVAQDQAEAEKAAWTGLRSESGRLADLEKAYLSLGAVAEGDATSTGQASRLECRRQLRASDVAIKRTLSDSPDMSDSPGLPDGNPFVEPKPPVVERAI